MSHLLKNKWSPSLEFISVRWAEIYIPSIYTSSSVGFPGGSVVKNPHANARDTGSIPRWGRSRREGNGTPLQYSCLGNPMDREAWSATVRGSQKSQTQLSMFYCNVLGQLAQYSKCNQTSIPFETVNRPSKCHSQLLVSSILSQFVFVVYFSISLLKRHGWTNRCTRNWWFNGMCIRRNNNFKMLNSSHNHSFLKTTIRHQGTLTNGLIVSQQWSS